MSVKGYFTGKIKVYWEPAKCIHSANCVNGLPSVFNQDNKPWITIDGDTADRIEEQVAKSIRCFANGK